MIKEYLVPGNHITAIGFVGPKLDHLLIITGTAYHDAYGNLDTYSTDVNDGRLYFVPMSDKGCDIKCKGRAGVPVANF